MKGYPVFFVHLGRARCVIVGGGPVATRKADGLLQVAANVVVVSPMLCKELADLASRGSVDVIRRDYQYGDLQGAALVIAATDAPEVNQQVWEEAKARGIPVNVVDDPEHCTFIAPSVLRRGPLTLAISTGGHCPALSRHLRKRLEQEFGPAYSGYVELLGQLREQAVAKLSLAERRVFWEQIFGSDVLALLTSGKEQEARRQAWAILEQHLPGRA